MKKATREALAADPDATKAWISQQFPGLTEATVNKAMKAKSPADTVGVLAKGSGLTKKQVNAALEKFARR